MVRRHDREEGAVAPLMALLLASMCGFAGLAVDMGLLQYERRSLQASVDAAALSAARAPSEAQAVGNAMLNLNGRSSDTRTIVTGTYQDNPALAAAQRFAAGNSASPNAVRVVAQRSVPLGLTRVLGGPANATVHATAVAAHTPLAAFAIGSTTASLNNGVLNQVLGSLLGGSVNLSAVSYTGLASTNLQLLSFLNALATSLNLSAGNYQSLLNTTTTAGNILNVAATALGTTGTSSASASAVSTTLSILGQSASGTQSFSVGQLIDLAIFQARGAGNLDPTPYANLGVNALDLVTAAASLGGANAATVPAGINLPGLASVSAQVMVVEPMQGSGPGPMGLGPVGTTVDTQQVRVLLSVRLLTLVGGGVVTLPVLVEVAPAQATLSSVSCEGQPGTDSQIGIQATTGVARAQIGQVTGAQFGSSGVTSFGTLSATPIVRATLPPILGINIGVTVSARASATVGSGTGQMTFTPADIAAHTTRTISSTGLTSTLISSLGSSLVLTTQVDLSLVPPLMLNAVNALLSGAVSGLLSTLTTTLTPVLAALDPVVDQVLAGVGVQVGSATVQATGVRCGVASLVL